MRYIAAYLLANLGGAENPSANDMSKILSSVGIDFNKEQAELVISELSGKTLSEVISTGSSKLASVPSGAAVSGSSAAPSSSTTSSGDAKKDDKKKAEKESEPESEGEMGFGLFD